MALYIGMDCHANSNDQEKGRRIFRTGAANTAPAAFTGAGEEGSSLDLKPVAEMQRLHVRCCTVLIGF